MNSFERSRAVLGYEGEAPVDLSVQWWQEFTDVGEGTIIDALFEDEILLITPEGSRDDREPIKVQVLRVANVGVGVDSKGIFSFVTVDAEELGEDLFIHRVVLFDNGNIENEMGVRIGTHRITLSNWNPTD